MIMAKVYDLTGKEVGLIVSEEMKAGTYKAGFDGSGLSSGVYFYELIAGDYILTKRMVLIR